MAPSSLSSQNQSDPLLASKATKDHPAEPISPGSSRFIQIVSIARIGLGAVCLVAPRWTFALFKFPIPAEMTILARLFGGRDLVLGEMLRNAEDKTLADGGKREVKRALWAGIGADALDVCSVAFALSAGTVGKLPGGLLAGGAATSVALGALVLRGL